MDKVYYKAYFDLERNHWWFRARSMILKSYISKRIFKDKRQNETYHILNVGVATGATSTMLQAFGSVMSIEYEEECIEFIKDKIPLNVIHGSILSLPFEANSFDLVCAFDVIEHVKDHQLAIDELVRVCKNHGSVFITVPSFMSLWSEHDEINHHFRRYRIKELVQMFNSCGGDVVFASYFNFFLFIPIFLIRKLSNIIRNNSAIAKSDFQKYKAGKMDSILYSLLKSERHFLNRRLSFPFGVSALLHWRKK